MSHERCGTTAIRIAIGVPTRWGGQQFQYLEIYVVQSTPARAASHRYALPNFSGISTRRGLAITCWLQAVSDMQET